MTSVRGKARRTKGENYTEYKLSLAALRPNELKKDGNMYHEHISLASTCLEKIRTNMAQAKHSKFIRGVVRRGTPEVRNTAHTFGRSNQCHRHRHPLVLDVATETYLIFFVVACIDLMKAVILRDYISGTVQYTFFWWVCGKA